MKRQRLLSAVLLMLLCVASGCSSDDEISEELIKGELWYLYKASYGFGGVKDVAKGEVILSFVSSDRLQVINKKGEKGHFLESGEYPYEIVTSVRNIWTNEQKEVEYRELRITTNNGYTAKFDIWFSDDGTMCLDGGIASDGPGYFFRKK